MARPKARLIVSPSERKRLQAWTRRRKTAQALATRARIVLLCDSGRTITTVAEKLDVSKQMVGKWRQRFIDQRLDGLLDEPRSGAPRKISDEDVERVIVKT
jgi:transposase